MNKDRIKTAVLEQVRAATGASGPVVAVDLPLGATGFVADLAVLDDEFIGIAVADASDTARDLSLRLNVCSRYFERMVLIARPAHLPHLDLDTLSGATIWTHDDEGRLIEHDAGTGNRVGLNARFDLLRMDERRYFLGELVVGDAAEPHGPFTVPAPRTRALFGMVFTARYGQASDAFWAVVADRAIAPGDLALLGGPAEVRDPSEAEPRERRRAAR